MTSASINSHAFNSHRALVKRHFAELSRYRPQVMRQSRRGGVLGPTRFDPAALLRVAFQKGRSLLLAGEDIQDGGDQLRLDDNQKR